jgi:hypothetical protein
MQTLLFVIKIKHRTLVSRIVCGIFVGLVSLWILPTVFTGFRDGPRSTNWPLVSGTVAEHRIVPIDRDGTGSRLGLKLVYQYQVDGVDYSGSRIDVANTEVLFHGELPQELQLLAQERFALGSSIDVYYDPDKPNQAVLVTGIVPTTYWQLLFVVFIIGAFTFYLLTTGRKKKSSASQDPASPDSHYSEFD